MRKYESKFQLLHSVSFQVIIVVIIMARPSEKMSAFEREKRLSTKGMTELLDVSRQTVWRRVKAGKLPKPIYPETHQPRWKFGEVMDWIEGFEKPYEAEARGLKGDEKLDEFVPPVRPTNKEVGKPQEVSEPPKQEEDTLGTRLRKRFGLE